MSFVEDVFGSFVEIIITVILMNLFSQDYSKNKLKLVLSITITSILVALLDLLKMPSTSLLNYLIVFLTLAVVIKRSAYKILLECVFASIALFTIEYVLAMLFYKIQGVDSLDFTNRCIQLIIVLIISCFLGLNRKLQIKVQYFCEEYQEGIYFIALTLFCFSAIELYLWKSNNEVVFRQAAIISLYMAILFSLCSFLLKKLIENKRQKENIQLHEQYMETTENLLDGLYSDKHDFNKHLQAIEGLCEYEEAHLAVKQIQLYIESLKEKERKKKKNTVSINTGNGVVNALLYSKAKEAEKRQIQFFYIPSGNFPKFPCEQYELVQIIGNLLDNAFEYLEKLEEEQRIVTLSICEKGNEKQIEVRNTYCPENHEHVSISQDSISSTKFGERRGYGLKNIKTIALKYHGKFSFFQEENKFIVEVLF